MTALLRFVRLGIASAIWFGVVGCKSDHASDPSNVAGAAGAGAGTGTAGEGGGAGLAVDSGLGLDAGDCEHPVVVESCANGWCTIPAGCFVMGSPTSEWARGAFTEEQALVTLTHSFEIGQHEVTQADWIAAGLPNPSTARAGVGDGSDPQCPVGNVTWFEAAEFANRASLKHSPPLEPCYELSGCNGALGAGFACDRVKAKRASLYECEGYRLPTFAEWEYAARAGTRTAFHDGDIHPQGEVGTCFEEPALEASAWYCWNSAGTTHPVGGKRANGWGLFDMVGNAGEWLNDEPLGKALPGPLRDPGGTLTESPQFRDWRNCSYNGPPGACRIASTLFGTPSNRGAGVGFRLVRTLRDH